MAAVIYNNETTNIGIAGINVTAYTDDDISDGVSSSAPGYVPTIFVPNLYGTNLQLLMSHLSNPVETTGVREFVRLQIFNVQDHLTTQQEAAFDFPKGWAVWVIIFGSLLLVGKCDEVVQYMLFVFNFCTSAFARVYGLGFRMGLPQYS